jgi:hypothetical protein
MLTRAFALALLASLAAFAACNQDDDHFPPAGECQVKCSEAVVGAGVTVAASTGSGGGGGAGGTGPAGTVTGVVGLYDNETFSEVMLYSGAATIIGFDGEQNQISAPYDGANGGSFTLTGLGEDPWMLVENTTGGVSDLFNTWSERPSTSDIQLAAVDFTVLEGIVESIPSPTEIIDGDAQVVIKIERAGVPLSGVTVQTALGAGTILYDAGGGGYTDVGATGVDGTILILNVLAGDDPTYLEVDVLDADMMPFALTNILITANAATVAGFSI